MAKIRRALISVSDKKGIVEFAKGLEKLGMDNIDRRDRQGAQGRQGKD